MTNTSHTLANTPKHILKLSRNEKLEFLNSFDRVFSDVDGVVWNLHHPIPQAEEGFKILINAGKEVSFISNNSIRPMSDFARKFKVLGMDFDEESFIHPAKSIVQYLKSINFKGLIYVIASDAVKNLLREAGYEFIDGPLEPIKESYTELARHIFGKEPVRAVIIDVDFNLSSTKLIRAHIFLRHPDCILIEGATDKLMPVDVGVDIIGPGPFSQIISDSTKKPLITLGKPGKALAEMVVQRFDIKDTKRVLMIGDMLEQDVGFGRQCGFQTLVVLTGGTTIQKLQEECNPANIPDYYADSMADFVEFVEDLNKAKV
ncbi:pyridoxal phosphate phosphatase [Ceratitis capitata]|uniref:pyridoxal phosphate phosphatase n=1 Tax=Ceratitis capitata TaxID=7213 RepID=UPI00032A2763|nr:pyridoxal phosphate phosphatase [Ceratitis capitata]